MADDPKQYIEPLRYRGTSDEARRKLTDVVEAIPRARIESASDEYIHAVFTSFLFRFKDDAQFFFNLEEKTIHVRSASRVGRSDLGVNRRRLERIRKEMNRG